MGNSILGCWEIGKAGLVKLTGGSIIFVAFFTALYPAIAFFNMGK